MGVIIGSPGHLRALNERAALFALLQDGPLSRLELDRAIGLSKPAAAELLSRLEAGGLVLRSGRRSGNGPGPHAQLWSANVRAGLAAGVDVTPGAITVAVADLSGTVVAQSRRAARGTPDPVAALEAAVAEAAAGIGVGVGGLAAVVVGIQGSVDPLTGHLEYATHMPRWTGFPISEALSGRLGVPVTVENDVNLVIVDEIASGCARGCHDVLLLWMSRGVAAAAVVNGRLVRGGRGGAGEIDKLPVRMPDGSTARVGTLLSRRAVKDLALRFGGSGTRVQSAFRRAGPDFLPALADRVAACVGPPIALLDPDLVILAGDVAVSAGPVLATAVTERVHGTLAHRARILIGGGGATSVRQGAVHAAVRSAREIVFGRGVESDSEREQI